MWLECETVMASGIKMVRVLKCSVCSKYKIRIKSSRNFSDRWIVGAKSLRTSNVRDHGNNNQHALAMSLLMKECATCCVRTTCCVAVQVCSTFLLSYLIVTIFKMHTMAWVAVQYISSSSHTKLIVYGTYSMGTYSMATPVK